MNNWATPIIEQITNIYVKINDFYQSPFDQIILKSLMNILPSIS